MRYYKRLKVYKASNVIFDHINMIATSYNWWKFVSKINGKVIFNNFRYSPSTNKHQYKVRSQMINLGIKIDLYIDSPQGLQDLVGARDYNLKKLGQALYRADQESAQYYNSVVTFLDETLNIETTDINIQDAVDDATLNDFERLARNYHQGQWNKKNKQVKSLEKTLIDRGVDTSDVSPNLVASIAHELNLKLLGSDDIVTISNNYRYPSYLRDQLINKKFNNDLNNVLS